MTERTFDRKQALIDAIVEGYQPEYVFFWSHRQKGGEAIDRHVLSQWYPAAFSIDGVRYPSAEHYMMAEKARLFGDQPMQDQILQAATAEEAKALGQLVHGFNLDIWKQHQIAIVKRGNEAKFGQNEALRRYLLSTGERILVEASPQDKIWGIGLAESDPRASDPRQWPGYNQLGFALMVVRARLAGSPGT